MTAFQNTCGDAAFRGELKSIIVVKKIIVNK